MEDFQKQTDELVKKIDEKKISRGAFLRGTIKTALGLGTVATVGTGTAIVGTKVAEAISNRETQTAKNQIEEKFNQLQNYMGYDVTKARALLYDFAESVVNADSLPNDIEKISFTAIPLKKNGKEINFQLDRKEGYEGVASLGVRNGSMITFTAPDSNLAEPETLLKRTSVVKDQTTLLSEIISKPKYVSSSFGSEVETYRTRYTLHSSVNCLSNDSFAFQLNEKTVRISREMLLHNGSVQIGYFYEEEKTDGTSVSSNEIYTPNQELVSARKSSEDERNINELYENFLSSYQASPS